ncbi:DUF4870 domain-containing protein [Hyalangium rubrum]|uniref:DUF4870 domain-containing protein n=1 Tax=Hyalangium rubrum TaxID=3103134 RepID=A0ABU5H5T1_9BACT|nr:DUF4870 domain-containing protein [Hyalangium sp. s54d21]MDY7228224.1 DUF4870 domain-containing protein [Hyalangium sp. s54d21]
MEQQQQGSPFLTGSPAPTEDDKTMALLAHIGGIVFPIIVPAIIMATKGEQSPWVKSQAVEALNFQIGVFIGYVVSTVLTAVCIGALLLPVVFIGATVLGIIAGLKAKEGQFYRYPATMRLVK